MLEKVVRYILGPLVAVLIFVVVVESALHFFALDFHPKGRDFTVNRAPDFPEVFLRDRNLLWRLRPERTITSEFFLDHSYRINRQGYRGDDFKIEKFGLRLAVLGNSCAFGWGVTEEETFAYRLKDGIGQYMEKPVEVFNFSVPGYSSFQGKGNYRQNVRRLNPDIMLVTFGWNDHWLAAGDIADKDQWMPPGLILDIQNQLARLRFYRLLKSSIMAIIPGPDLEKEKNRKYRVGPDDFRANLAEIIKTAATEGTKVVLLTSPAPSMEAYYDHSGSSILHETHRYYNDMIRQTAAIHSVGLVDLAGIFDRYDNLFDDVKTDPFHYNRRGHAVAAEEILQFLITSGYFPSEREEPL
ncbi:MAG: SGNH/GDSL hydrolase family protein [FCB group bacterium]|nr:SGNH/GDSL hydrolase family protein [FCB group bacterium]